MSVLSFHCSNFLVLQMSQIQHTTIVIALRLTLRLARLVEFVGCRTQMVLEFRRLKFGKQVFKFDLRFEGWLVEKNRDKNILSRDWFKVSDPHLQLIYVQIVPTM